MELFKDALKMMQNKNHDSLVLSLANVHHSGLFSLVIDGTEHGRLTRVFIALKEIDPMSIQLHTHCYPLKLGVIKGTVLHHNAYKCGHGAVGAGIVKLNTYDYQSPLNNGNGLEMESVENLPYTISSHFIPVSGVVELDENDIHSVSCKAGSMWIVQEQGLKSVKSLVVGNVFGTKQFYNKVGEKRIEEMYNLVYNELIKITGE